MFNYHWKMSEYPTEKIDIKVFGTFICAGGSTMGYKLNGFNHLGGVEIDTKISKVYEKNHKPKFLYTDDIRSLFNYDLPKELYDLDILDGSPPCSSFSTVGNREKDWGKKKVFVEGQTKQVLDDLFFEYLNVIDKLRPKIFIAENVKGLIFGNAKKYVFEIMNYAKKIGYECQIFLLDSSLMGVPQKRERVFVVGKRIDLNLKTLKIKTNQKPILYGEIKDYENDYKLKKFTELKQSIWENRDIKDTSFSQACERMFGKESNWSVKYVKNNKVMPTIISGGEFVEYSNDNFVPLHKLIQAQSFPIDFDFGTELYNKIQFMLGMSVPPLMMANLSKQIYEQLF